MKTLLITLAIGLFPLSAFADIIPAAVIQSVNTQRTQNGLAPLTISATLTKVAEDKVNDEISKGYFAHEIPGVSDQWYFFAKEGYRYSYADENLAVCFVDTETETAAWMNSPTHRANILDPHVRETGVAVGYGFYRGAPCIFVAQEFGLAA